MTAAYAHARSGGGWAGSSVRPLVAIAALISSLVFVVILHLALPDEAAKLLIDRGGYGYPVSVQNVMWIAFFVGMGELLVRFHAGSRERHQLLRGFLPEDDQELLLLSDMSRIYARVAQAGDYFLPRLIRRTVLQVQTSRSVDRANTLLTSSLDLLLHEIDLRYNMVRYLMWLIPTLGFIGTVIGISLALDHAGSADFNDPTLLGMVTSKLAVAFHTTLLALLQAGFMVFCMHIAQGREEESLNLAGQYCLDHLINRLLEE